MAGRFESQPAPAAIAEAGLLMIPIPYSSDLEDLFVDMVFFFFPDDICLDCESSAVGVVRTMSEAHAYTVMLAAPANPEACSNGFKSDNEISPISSHSELGMLM
jgi:hypothetical protein